MDDGEVIDSTDKEDANGDSIIAGDNATKYSVDDLPAKENVAQDQNGNPVDTKGRSGEAGNAASEVNVNG